MSLRAQVAVQLLNAAVFAITLVISLSRLTRLAAQPDIDAWPRQRLVLVAYIAVVAAFFCITSVHHAVDLTWRRLELDSDIPHPGTIWVPVVDKKGDTENECLSLLALWFAEAARIYTIHVYTLPNRIYITFVLGCMVSAMCGLVLATAAVAENNYASVGFLIAFYTTAVINIFLSIAVAARLTFWDKDPVFNRIARSYGSSCSEISTYAIVLLNAFLTLGAVVSTKVMIYPLPYQWMIIPVFVMPQITTINSLFIIYGLPQAANEGSIRLEDEVPAGEKHAGVAEIKAEL